MSKAMLSVICIGTAVLGVVIARTRTQPIFSSARSTVAGSLQSDGRQLPKTGWIASVGDESISAEDIEWEATLHTTAPKISDGDQPVEAGHPSIGLPTTAENDPVATPDKVLGESSDSLRHRLLVTVLERKILYHWIKGHSEGFDHENPSRYLSCLSELKELTENVTEFFSTQNSKERLKAKLCEQSVIDQYLHEKIYSSVRISEQDITGYYKLHSDEFKVSQRVVFLQILLPTEKAAVELKPKINRSNFEQLARAHSIAPEAQNGGKVGPFSRDQLPTFFDIVFNMQIGEISGIVRSAYGFHIILSLERLPAAALSLGESRRMIVKKLEGALRQELYQTWLTAAMNAITVRSNVGEKDP